MDQIKDQCLRLFSNIFPYIHNVFISYILILILLIALAFILYLCIKNLKTNSNINLFFKALLIFLEIVVIVFLLWFVFQHFHTYSLWETKLKFNGQIIN